MEADDQWSRLIRAVIEDKEAPMITFGRFYVAIVVSWNRRADVINRGLCLRVAMRVGMTNIFVSILQDSLG